MKKHSGMRPHDIVILLKIAAKGSQKWFMKDLSYELNISASEISESINRSVIAGLIAPNKKKLMKLALMDFLEHGLRYVYPQQPGAMVRGIPTAHSAAPLNTKIVSNEHFGQIRAILVSNELKKKLLAHAKQKRILLKKHSPASLEQFDDIVNKAKTLMRQPKSSAHNNHFHLSLKL